MNIPKSEAPSRIELPGGYFISLEGDYAYLRREPFSHVATLEQRGDFLKIANFAAAMTRLAPQQAAPVRDIIDALQRVRQFIKPEGADSELKKFEFGQWEEAFDTLRQVEDLLVTLQAQPKPEFGVGTAQLARSGFEFAWLVEWPADDNMPSRWWHPDGGWMIDASKAIRFSRRLDAEDFLKTCHMTATIATEHGFDEAPPLPAPSTAM